MSVYYIKQKLSLRDNYIIYDANDKPVLQVIGSVYTVTFERMFGNIFSIGHVLRVKNLEGEIQIIVKRKPGFLWKKYNITIDNDFITLNEDKNFITPKMHIKTQFNNYFIKGDILGKEFTIVKDNIEIAQITKKFLSLTDIYEINVHEDTDDKLGIAILIAVDSCYHN